MQNQIAKISGSTFSSKSLPLGSRWWGLGRGVLSLTAGMQGDLTKESEHCMWFLGHRLRTPAPRILMSTLWKGIHAVTSDKLKQRAAKDSITNTSLEQIMASRKVSRSRNDWTSSKERSERSLMGHVLHQSKGHTLPHKWGGGGRDRPTPQKRVRKWKDRFQSINGSTSSA